MRHRAHLTGAGKEIALEYVYEVSVPLSADSRAWFRQNTCVQDVEHLVRITTATPLLDQELAVLEKMLKGAWGNDVTLAVADRGTGWEE